MTLNAADLINLDRYPIDGDTVARLQLVKQTQAALAHDGCAVLKGFLSEAGVNALKAEAESVSEKGHCSYNRTNPYFTKDNPDLPATYPRRAFFDRSNNFIPADNFATTGPLRTLQNHPAFDPFIQVCLEEEKFFRYADPLADVIIY